MNFAPFSIAQLPQIHFGSGRLEVLAQVVPPLGRRILLVTGAQTLSRLPNWEALQTAIGGGCEWHHVVVAGEPSPQCVDQVVREYKDREIELVLAIGGGSVLDGAKAIAGLLPHGNSVLDHLEGVGKGMAYEGPATPFIAVPTTAGTGSEATKNAVLSVVGEQGYKKSFRHDSLVARHAIVDPDLLASCPPEQMAANGMDALTQLLESYVSTRANPFTDALAVSGLRAVGTHVVDAFRHAGDGDGASAREAMAYGALLSGITLAQVGLGSVHGLASPLGAFYPIGHGVVCGALVAEATAVNIEALEAREPDSDGLRRYADAGRILSGRSDLGEVEARQVLVDVLRQWTEELEIPGLARLGVPESDYDKIVANSRGNSMKTNPIVLTDDEIKTVLRRSALRTP